MQKNTLYNYQSIDESLETNRLSQLQNNSYKTRVDINKLLNRVKMDKKNETKRKIIFFSFGILLMSFMGIYVSL